MQTYFASADRTDPDNLRNLVDVITGSPIVAGLLKSARGLTAILNENRQVLSINESYLSGLGIEDAGRCLGLRPGEMLGCTYANTAPGGCGTTPACPSCGAVLALVASLEENVPVEKTCAMRVAKSGTNHDLCFRVKSVPFELEGNRLLLLFMQDITEQEERLALSRIFLHDISNLAMILAGAQDLLEVHGGPVDREDRQRVVRLIERMLRAIRAQRSLLEMDEGDFSPARSQVTATELVAGVEDLYRTHEAAAGIVLEMNVGPSNRSIRTDPSLVHRVLANMVINACEASRPGEVVTVRVEEPPGSLRFLVHNSAVMPPVVARRIFQKHYSTKGGEGRGLGTYSMKVLAEEFLEGQIDFQSRPGLGTTFTLTLPA